MNDSQPSSPTASARPQSRRTEIKRAVLRPALIAGCYTGAMLTVALLGSLVVANRIPALEPYAFERNTISYALFVLIMLLPVLRFLNHPVKMFVAAVSGWAILTAAYDFSGLYFHNLFNVVHRAPFELLAEGVIAYGILSLCAWICRMVVHACRHSLAPIRGSRPRPISGHR
jgi:hypothetical protein